MSVTGGDAVDLATLDQVVEKGMAGAASFLLQIAGSELGFVQMEGQSVGGRQRADEIGVLPGSVAANSVLDMHDRDMEIPARSELMQSVQQENGIGASGNGDADALARQEHFTVIGVVEEAIEHSTILGGDVAPRSTYLTDKVMPFWLLTPPTDIPI